MTLFMLAVVSQWFQWSAPVRLSLSDSADITPVIVNNPVFMMGLPGPAMLAYASGRNGNWDIYTRYADSMDMWGPEVPVETPSSNETSPSLAFFAPEFRVAYESDANGSRDIYVSRYAGGAWQTPVQVTADIADDANPSLHYVGNPAYRYWLLFDSDRNGNRDIYGCYNDGGPWSVPIQITSLPYDETRPTLAQGNGLFWVLFERDSAGVKELFGTEAYNSDTSFSAPVRLVASGVGSERPRGYKGYDFQMNEPSFTFHDQNGGSFISYYSGVSSAPDDTISQPGADCIDPVGKFFEAATAGPNFAGALILYSTNVGGDWNVYYHTWLEGGAVDTSGARDTLPDISSTSAPNEDRYIWVVWQSDRDGDENIYGSWAGDHWGGVVGEGSPSPGITTLRYSSSTLYSSSDAEVSVYNVAGRLVQSLSLVAGRGVTLSLPAGVYSAVAVSGEGRARLTFAAY